jgi:hypothetical protein
MFRTSMTMGLLDTFFMSVRNSEEMDMNREVSTGRRVLMSAEPLQDIVMESKEGESCRHNVNMENNKNDQ